MDKSCLRQLKALIISFNFYWKCFWKNHSIIRYGQKYDFFHTLCWTKKWIHADKIKGFLSRMSHIWYKSEFII